jgi:hypothetical protein
VPEETSRETKVVQVVVSPEISPEQLTELLFRVGEWGTDCRGCGLIGLDVRLTGQDPEVEAPAGVRSMVVS